MEVRLGMCDEGGSLAWIVVPQLDALMLEPELGVGLADEVADARVHWALVLRDHPVRERRQIPAALQLGREDVGDGVGLGAVVDTGALARLPLVDERAERVALDRGIHRWRHGKAFG